MFAEEDLKIGTARLHEMSESDLSQLLNGHATALMNGMQTTTDVGRVAVGDGRVAAGDGRVAVGGAVGDESADRQSSTSRSISATPSQNGEEQPEQELEEDAMDGHPSGDDVTPRSGNQPTDMRQDINELKTGFVYMSHQMSRIMKALHVPPCMCETCAIRHSQMITARPLDDPSPMLQALFPSATTMQLSALADLAKAGKPQYQQNNQQQNMQQQHRLGTGYGQSQGGGKIHSITTDKRIVAEYARQHGAVAAAKRFGIPPPVSTYYQRKDSSNALVNPATASPGPSSEGENENVSQTPELSTNNNGQQQQQAGNNQQMAMGTQQQAQPTQQQQQSQQPATQQTPSVPPSPLFPGNMGNMMDMLKMNAAHASGSPGFLRGRGRGRPKLIGDELDADLVDYMVTVKQADPHGHLTASQALIIAKQYILEKAPGLLEEHGGHVKLKLTWAMKLVSRIAERQKEMELGLPAGTLSNMGRHHLNNLPGGNFMADMMAQNIMSQHQQMMMGMGQAQADSPPTSQPNGAADSVKEESVTVGATPEITNVQELNMKFLTNLFNGGANGKEEEMSGLIEGELPATCQEGQEKNAANFAGEVPMTMSN